MKFSKELPSLLGIEESVVKAQLLAFSVIFCASYTSERLFSQLFIFVWYLSVYTFQSFCILKNSIIGFASFDRHFFLSLIDDVLQGHRKV